LEHIPHDASLIVIIGATPHVYALRYRNLHVIDVMLIPDRLKNGVGKAEVQDILRRLFAQIMVDAVNLAFLKHLMNGVVQALSGF